MAVLNFKRAALGLLALAGAFAPIPAGAQSASFSTSTGPTSAPTGVAASAPAAVPARQPPAPASASSPGSGSAQPATVTSAFGNTLSIPAPVVPPPPQPPERRPDDVVTGPIAPAAAKDLDPAPLQTLSQSVARLEASAPQAKTDAGMTAVRQQAAQVETSANGLASARERTLQTVDAELDRLSTKFGGPRPRLSDAELRDRRQLLAQKAQLTGELQTAEKASAAAAKTYNAIASVRRNSFASKVFERTASPLEQSFWVSLADSLGPDARRLESLLQNAGRSALAASEPRAAIAVVLALLLAAAIALPLRRRIKAFSRRRTAAAVSAGGLRLSAHAMGAVILDTLLPGIAIVIVNLGLVWADVLSDRAEALMHALIIAVFWGAAVLALSRQLAGAADPDERLLPVSERLARHMRALPWLVAVVTGAGFLLNRINVEVGASLAATIAANCLVALAYAAVATLVLLALGADVGDGEDDEPERAPGRMLLALILTAAIAVTVIAVFAGFSTFAALVARQIFWLSVIAAVTYLLLRFTDDLMRELFRPHGRGDRMLTTVFSLRHSTVQQLGVLISGVLQIVIAIAAIGFALTPFNGDGGLLSSRLVGLSHVVRIGSITISPSSVGAAFASLVVGLALVNLLDRWVDKRFLPVTDWDSGVRNSVSTGIRYLGIALAVLWALAAAGLGFRQIALVASALSVGIGFGLQQIVQNFVSGLILLVERPVKVGDWVNLGGVEGDIKRIRVRATEIETFDRTTLIVPNSDLITKQVQNKTLGDPRGRVQLKFAVAGAANAPRAGEKVMAMMKADRDVLKNPDPKVFIDSLNDGGGVNFVCYAYVATPRDAARIRSKLYGELIALFAAENIAFASGPSTSFLEPGPQMRSFIGDLAAARGHARAAEVRADEPAPEEAADKPLPARKEASPKANDSLDAPPQKS